MDGKVRHSGAKFFGAEVPRAVKQHGSIGNCHVAAAGSGWPA